jgi:flagellar hook-length control protein FliK
MQALRTVGADLTGLYAARSLKAGGRVFLTAPARAAGPSGAGNLKGGGTAPDSAATTRSSATTRTLHTAKTDSTRSAGSAARDANIERIVRVIHSRVTEQRSHTVMRLAPPELGSLRLQMDLRGVALTLRIDTATEMAHRLLSEDLDKLRHGLEASGIQLERVEVRPPAQPPQAGEHGGWQHADQQGQSQEESAQTGAEHPGEHGTESHPAESTEGPGRGTHLEPAAESLVNLVA